MEMLWRRPERERPDPAVVDEVIRLYVCWREACDDVRGAYKAWTETVHRQGGSGSTVTELRSSGRSTQRRCTPRASHCYSTSLAWWRLAAWMTAVPAGTSATSASAEGGDMAWPAIGWSSPQKIQQPMSGVGGDDQGTT